jgi:hypothetical protein
MAERKVLNKYYPPDFDPSKIRNMEKKSVRRMCNVRMMLPMTIRCYTCGNYLYIGTKFNMKVETVREEDYLGIKVYRFYLKCTQCYGEITFKTDPRNHDYVAEWGASRNHNPWKDMLMAEEEFKEIKQSEMKEDAMKSLEHRTYDSKREMDILDALDQVKNLNRRQADVNTEELIQKAITTEREKELGLTEEDISAVREKYEKFKTKRIEDYLNVDSDVNNFQMSSGDFKDDMKTPNSFLNKKTNREDEDSDDSDEENINKVPKAKNGLLFNNPLLKSNNTHKTATNGNNKLPIKLKIIKKPVATQPPNNPTNFKKPKC